MGKKLTPLEEELADIWSVVEQVATKDYHGAKWLTGSVLQRLITRWPRAAEAALGADLPVYQSLLSVRTKAAGVRPMQMRALNLIESLGDQMDAGAYTTLMQRIIPELEQAQRTLDQGFSQASQQAAGGVVTNKKSAKPGFMDGISESLQRDSTIWL